MARAGGSLKRGGLQDVPKTMEYLLNKLNKEGFKKIKPIRLPAPNVLSAKGLALYASAFATKALMASPVPPKEGLKTS